MQRVTLAAQSLILWSQFVESCYNPLMAAVKATLVRESAQENDETYYLWAMRFFMEFQRRHDFRVEFVRCACDGRVCVSVSVLMCIQVYVRVCVSCACVLLCTRA